MASPPGKVNLPAGLARPFALALLLAGLATVPPAQASIRSFAAGDAAGPLALAQAMAEAAPPGLVVSASWLTPSPIRQAGVADAAITSTFGVPEGGRFAILTSGAADAADDPQQGVQTGHAGTFYRGARDAVVLQIQLDLPAGHDCLGFRFQFLSEEFPAYANHPDYNDAFLAELDAHTWDVQNSTILAPANFAKVLVGLGEVPVTVSAVPMTASHAVGSVYGGGSSSHVARVPVAPTGGAHVLTLSLFDMGDHRYDSAVFLDALESYAAPGSGQPCQPGVELVPPPPPPPPAPASPPEAEFSFHVDAASGIVQFADRTIDPNNDVVDWVWDFGDAAAGAGRRPDHPYARKGTYPVTLAATDSQGHADAVTHDVVVPNRPPVLLGLTSRLVAVDDLAAIPVGATDADGESLDFQVLNLPQGARYDPVTQQIRWTPRSGDEGRHVVTLRASDSEETAEGQVVLEVFAPVIRADHDADGVPDDTDNCPNLANPAQDDGDDDGVGDACTPRPVRPSRPEAAPAPPDRDGDGVADAEDSCADVPNPGQRDRDGDWRGDDCDPDADGDRVADVLDNCPALANPDQVDADGSGRGDACEMPRGAAAPPGCPACRPTRQAFPPVHEAPQGREGASWPWAAGSGLAAAAAALAGTLGRSRRRA